MNPNTGGLVDLAMAGRLDGRDLAWTRRGAWLYAPGALLLSAGAAAVPFALGLDGLRAPGILLAVLVAGLALVALGRHAADDTGGTAAVLLAGSAFLVLAAGVTVLPRLEETKPVPRLAASIRALVPPGTPVAAHAFREPSLGLELGSGVELLDDAAAVTAWTARRGAGVLVLPRPSLLLVRTPAAARVREIASSRGWNVSTGRRVDLVALLREDAGPDGIRK